MKFLIPRLIADLLLALATYSLLRLVLGQSQHGDVCPPLLGVPACYPIFASVLMAWVGRFWIRARWMYWFGCFFPWVIALFASIFQLLGKVECPTSSYGVPMCFLSLGLFSVVLVLSAVAMRTQSRPG